MFIKTFFLIVHVKDLNCEKCEKNKLIVHYNYLYNSVHKKPSYLKKTASASTLVTAI